MKETTNKVPEVEKPKYATAQDFREQHLKTRFSQSSDELKGHKPTAMQKRWLVITRMFKRKEDIPEYISIGTLNSLSDRLRIVFIVVGCVSFFTVYAASERYMAYKIERDKKRGVVVTKM
uniref:Small integral membrane protein 8 n=1 Tax=Parastrongyloides trichosuri TaxID=131310 RepID=A0A0N5A4H6_PARTI